MNRFIWDIIDPSTFFVTTHATSSALRAPISSTSPWKVIVIATTTAALTVITITVACRWQHRHRLQQQQQQQERLRDNTTTDPKTGPVHSSSSIRRDDDDGTWVALLPWEDLGMMKGTTPGLLSKFFSCTNVPATLDYIRQRAKQIIQHNAWMLGRLKRRHEKDWRRF